MAWRRNEGKHNLHLEIFMAYNPTLKFMEFMAHLAVGNEKEGDSHIPHTSIEQ